MTTDRRAFLKQSATLGLVLAARDVLKADEQTPARASRFWLANEKLRLHFDSRGLLAMEDIALKKTFRFKNDGFKLEIDGKPIASAALQPAGVTPETTRLTFTYTAAPYKVLVVYELRPGWRFVSKQVLVAAPQEASFTVQSAEPLQFQLDEGISELYVQQSRYPKILAAGAAGVHYPIPETDEGIEDTEMKSYAAFLRMAQARGFFALLQNPFFECNRQGQTFSLRYSPDMKWHAAWGPFPCDRACVGPYELTGRKIPTDPVPEWESAERRQDGQDQAEVEAVTDCVDAFLMVHPEKAVRMHCGWYENDYQIDISKESGRQEYKRIIDATAGIGCGHLNFCPQNTGVSSISKCIESWNGDYVTWLSLGQKIADGSWRADRDPVPDSIQEMLDYAKSKNIRMMAYVYPDLAFTQRNDWLTPNGKHSSLAYRELQDWLIETMVSFKQKTGLGGYFFDYVYLSFPGTSRYAQWFGWRRVQQEMRRKMPDIVISGGAYHGFYGPWLHVAGNWPWPMFGDEQPESHRNFKDLHFARVEANRMRYTNFLYRNYEYYPTEALPGFISHQEPRHGGTEEKETSPVEDNWRLRNFDYLGWKYSTISSIGYAGINHVIGMLPARDTEEFRYFIAADQAWLRKWLDWTDENIEFLRHTRLILGEPALGRADGSSAIVGQRGFIFLYNPNLRKVEVSFPLDLSIGLSGGGEFTLRELYPLEGRFWGKAGAGVWRDGDRVTATLDGTSATVLELAPVEGRANSPVLFDAPGKAVLDGGHLVLSEVRGEVGAEAPLLILLPVGSAVEAVTVNGTPVKLERQADTVTVHARFRGELFSRSQQIGRYDPQFAGGLVRGEFRIPSRIKRQLEARRKAWPMPWTEEDLQCSWLAPERLLLFVAIATPEEKMTVKLEVDGNEIALQKAYASIRPNPRAFIGLYADISSLEADRTHRVELNLPNLKPGDFQGLFFENVETEYTDRVVA